MEKIDIVLTWVDGSDLAWQKERMEYASLKRKKGDQSDAVVRYRNWDNLQYVLRGIEKNMPWVNKVHLITYGHLPKWINKECKKLHIVRHEDYIPKEYLPTFNSNVIELNMHRIEGLSEYFINFNDDIFVIKKTEASDFFVNGKPCDSAVLSPQLIYRGGICNTVVNNLEIINDYFSIRDIKKNWKKWFDLTKYRTKSVRTFLFLQFSKIIGIYETHIAYSYCKSTFEEVWRKEKEELQATCKNKFRTKEDINHWLFRYWQLLSGDFEPRNINFGILKDVGTQIDDILKILHGKGKYKMICINDSDSLADFEKTKTIVNEALDTLFPEKSSFEI